MTENQILESASLVGAQTSEDGRWVFEDDEHLVEFALEVIQMERDRVAAAIQAGIRDLIHR